MAKGLPRSHKHANKSLAPIVRETLVPINKSITVDGSATIGFGSLVIGDFPQGNIVFVAAVSYFAFAGTGSDADLSDVWEGDYSIGTTPPSDGTLTGTDVDIIPSTALAAATAEVSPRTRAEHAVATTGQVFDNTDGSLEINLGLLIDDAHIAGIDSVLTVAGELYLSYIVLGDD